MALPVVVSVVVCAIFTLAACEGGGGEAGRPVLGEPDSALMDAAPPADVGSPDSAPPADVSAPDSALPDSALMDSALPDSALPDSALPDATPADDMGSPDAAPADMGPLDAEVPLDAEPPLDAEALPDVYLPPEVTLPPCDPPLTARLERPRLAPLGLSRVIASGGGGRYALTVAEDASGGALVSDRPLTYLAGRRGGVWDRLRLRDLSCEGEVTLDAEVLPPLTLSPSTARVPPGACLTLTASGGSGGYAFSVASAAPLGSVDERGRYTTLARDAEGVEVVRVTDTLTGERADARLTFTAEATLDLGGERIFLPRGSSLRAALSLGGGRPELVSSDPEVVRVEGSDLRAVGAGEALVRAREPAVGCLGPNGDAAAEVGARVRVVEPLPTDLARAFVGSQHRPRALALDDMNGDGLRDLLLTDAGAHWGGRYSGGGALLLTTDDPAAPLALSQTWTGLETFGRWGDALALVDVNADGLEDLAVGASGERLSGVGRGVVYLYLREPGGGFSATPHRVLSGLTGDFNAFGSALAACDFNGDGRQDLAVGAPDGISAEPYLVARGYISVYLGEEGGLSPVPRQMIWGLVPEGLGWKPLSFMHLGGQLAAGDVDGDGRCDLAAQSRHEPQARDVAGQTYSADYMGGVVWLYAGSPRGLSGTPSLHFTRLQGEAGYATNNAFGMHMALRDLTGDGRAELVTPSAVFLGGALPSTPRVTPAAISEAAWRSELYSSLPFDIADVDEDGRLDLLVGDRGLKVLRGREAGEGEAPLEAQYAAPYSFRTTDQSPAAHAALPLRQPPVGGGTLGVGIAHLGGGRTLLSDSNGPAYQLGAHWLWDGGEAGAGAGATAAGSFARVPLPLQTSDTRVGASVAVADITGEGAPAVVVGAPGAWAGEGGFRYSAGDATDGFLGGVAGLYFPEPAAHGGPLAPADLPLPDAALDPFGGYWVRFGQAARGAGDVDGDGLPDLAVVNPDAGLPGSGAGSWPFISCNPAAPEWREGAWRCPVGSAMVRWGGISEQLYEVPAECANRAALGSIDIYSGRARSEWSEPSEAGGAGPRPTWSLFGGVVNARAGAAFDYAFTSQTLAADFDLNGDGFADVALGAPTGSWGGKSGAGVVQVFLGAPSPDPRKTQVRCAPDLTLGGAALKGSLGWSLEPLRDLDADGCDELLMGAPGAPERDAWNPSWEGRVFLLLGYGPTCARPAPEVLALSAGLYTGVFGWSIAADARAGGEGAGGEGRLSVAISAPYALSNGVQRGVVLGLSRDDLRAVIAARGVEALPAEGVGARPAAHPLSPRFDSPWTAWGEATKSALSLDAIYATPNSSHDTADRFGASLAWVPQASGPPLLAVGAPRRDYAGATDAGEVTLWREGLEGRLGRVGRVVGQTWRPGSLFGVSLAGGRVAGRDTLVVGAPFADVPSQAGIVEGGGAFLIDMEEGER